MASLTYSAIAPGTGGGCTWPTSGNTWAASLSEIGRAINCTSGNAVPTFKFCKRRPCTRSTFGRAEICCTTSGGKYKPCAVCVEEVSRAYSGAGSMVSSQVLTETRKLLTITVSATPRLNAATTPLTATTATSRMRRARSTASIGKAREATNGESLS